MSRVVRRARRTRAAGGALAALLVLAAPAVAAAYVGPGAGIAFFGTAFTLLATILLTLLGLLSWPFRRLYRLLRRRRRARPPRIRRAIVVGLDGLDPVITRRLLDAGKLPAMQALAARGTFQPLATTCPSMSPVAWSSFATGVGPGKHGIFDFVAVDPRTYRPRLSSVEIGPPARELRLGSWRLPLGRPRVVGRRRSRSFWRDLTEHGVRCSVLRVPLTFPAEAFDGTLLAGMCVPDLRGTQGTFTCYTTAPPPAAEEGAAFVRVTVAAGRVRSVLEGPANPIRPSGPKLALPLELRLAAGPAGAAELRLGRERVRLAPGAFSDWIPVAFPMGLGLKLRGMVQARLTRTGDELQLYLTPIHLDPTKPALPLAHPRIFSMFLGKLLGRFATLGLAEDTTALAAGVLDPDAFLEQLLAIHDEREAMFFEMLERTPDGVLACVFDGTDRAQHMFMREAEEAAAAPPGAAAKPPAVEAVYVRMDRMLARLAARVDLADPETLVVVMSDHGFRRFRREVSLNQWLLEQGYLALEDGATESGEWFAAVDWSRTRAYAFGLAGIYLNRRGREAHGIVEPGAAAVALAEEIAARLEGLVDPEGAPAGPGAGAAGPAVAVQKVYRAADVFRGPYADEGPALVVGYAPGWRVSWGSARGAVAGPLFRDNPRAWSGDHCIDPAAVPGVLLANQPLGRPGEPPAIVDLAPTLLDLFGVALPPYLDGRSLAP